MSISYFQFTKLKSEQDFLTGTAPDDLFEKCKAEINGLPYYKDHVFRKNGVMCLDILFIGFISDTEHAKWEQTNELWTRLYFTQAVCLDNITARNEQTYEQHIYIIPLSPRGAVSCDWYCGGKDKLRHMHLSYTAYMKDELGITVSKLGTFLQHQNKRPGYNPFSVMTMPDPSDFKDIQTYHQAVSEYIQHIQTDYETKIQNLEGKISEALIVENRYLKKENNRLDKYIAPYLEFLSAYGGIKKASKMLKTAQMYQYAIRLYQENGDITSIENAKQILNDGIEYMKKHNITE